MVLFSGLWTTYPRSEDSKAHTYQQTENGNDDSSILPTGNNKRVSFHPEQEEDQPSLTTDVDLEDDHEVLKLCLMYMSIYVVIAVIAYSFVFENWSIIDSLYFAANLFSTVGYGDLEPTNTPSQIFTILFAVYGVIILGVFIGIVGHAISKGQERAIAKLRKKTNKKMLKALFKQSSSMSSRVSEKDGLLRNNTSWWHDQITLMDDVLYVIKAEAPEILGVMFFAWILGMREGWTLLSTLYFTIMSASTTGFGDYTPTNQLDKLYCVFFLPLSVAVFGEVLGRIASVYITRRMRRNEYEHLKKAINMCDLRKMDTNKDGVVDFGEFLSFMLVALGKVDKESIDDLWTIFAKFDTNGNGVLEKEDLVQMSQRGTWQKIKDDLKREEEEEEAPYGSLR